MLAITGDSYSPVTNLQIQSSTHSPFEMCEELSLENTIDQGIWLLRRADTQRKPIVLQRGRADKFDGTKGYRAFRGNRKLPIHQGGHDNVHFVIGLQKVSLGLQMRARNETHEDQYARTRFTGPPKLRNKQFASTRKQNIFVTCCWL
jgi:hypothetical protein